MKINITVTLERQNGPVRNSDQVFDALAEEIDGTWISVGNESGEGDEAEYAIIDVQRMIK